MSEVAVSREERRQTLSDRAEYYRFQMRALQELASEIENLNARCQGYRVVWVKVARRLREDAAAVEKDLNKTLERLEVLNEASEAADRYRSIRP